MDHGFIAPLIATLTGQKREARERHGADTIWDNVIVGAVELIALVVGFRAVRDLTDSEAMGVIGALVLATTATETVCELSERFVWLPSGPVPVAPPQVLQASPAAPQAAPLPTPQAPSPPQPFIVFGR